MKENIRPLIKRLASGLILASTLALAVFVAYNLLKDLSLWIFGVKTDALVVDRWYEQVGDPQAPSLGPAPSLGQASEPQFRYLIRYQFTTPEGKTYSKTTNVHVMEWAGSGLGGPAQGVYYEQAIVPQDTVGGIRKHGTVAIEYLPWFPAHSRLDDSRYVPFLACLYVPLLVLIVVGFKVGGYLVRST